MSGLKEIQFRLARALEDGGGSDEEAQIYVSEIVACVEERIVKLIDSHIGRGHCESCNDDTDGCELVSLIALINKEKLVEDPIEKGYRLLSEDSEMFQRRQSHRCGFDFLENQATAKCKCGVVSTNPFWTFRGDK
jgi:hypothetical protein